MEESIDLIDIELLKFKDDGVVAFKNFRALCEKQSDCQLKIFHIDGEWEYMEGFDNYFKENDINHEVTAVYSPEQNDKAERINRTIQGLDRAILAQ